MYPSFTSLSQRERKRNELLEKAKRRVAQANAKREMYSDAAWSSDVGKTIDINRSSTVETTKSVSSNQPIEKEAAVTTDDKSSQTIPEASSPISESNVSPVMVDNETSTDRIDQTDRHIQASPTTADVGVENGIDMVDASVSVKPSTVDEATNTSSKPSRLDTEDQVEARKWIKDFFTKHPNWVALRLHPVRKKDHKDDKRYVIGETGSLLSIKNGKKYKRYEYIDWVATEEKVRNIWYDAESQSIDEVSAMRDEENLTKTLLRLEKKRAGDELEELDVILKDRRLPDITFGRKSTSTTSDDEQSRMKMLWIISKNKEMLDSNGLIKSIIPIYKDIFKSDKTTLEQYVWVKNGSIDVFGQESNLEQRSALTKIDWQSTLRTFLQMMQTRGLELSMVGSSDVERDVKDYKPYDDDEEREARHGTRTGLDEDVDKNLTIPDMEAKKMLHEYYKRLFDKKIVIPFRLKPVVDSKNGVKPHETFYFSVPSEDRYLNIRDKNHKTVSGKALTDLMKTIRWMDTFYALLSGLEDAHRAAEDVKAPATQEEKKMIKNVNDNFTAIRKIIFSNAKYIKQESGGSYDDSELNALHNEAERAYLNYGEGLKQVEIIRKRVNEAEKEARQTNNKRTNSALKAERSALRAASAAVRATKAIYNTKYKKYSKLVQELAEEEERERAADEFAKRGNAEMGRGVRLQGRGLKGAGVAPLEGVVRRGRTYNLNEIQGLATPSAHVYRQLGSKYIRLPDLDANSLVIVQPNRRKCGPKKDISDSLQTMTKNLVYNKDINQADYDKLSVDDKKLFKEILAITHLQYNFIDKLPDPLGSLRMEYDKLKGEY